jgi:hypothetical protein
MGNLFVNGNRAIGFGGRTTGGTGTQRSAFRVRLNLPPVQGGGPDPQDVVNWLASIATERDSWLNYHSAAFGNNWIRFAGGWVLSKLYRQPSDTSVFQYIASYSPNPVGWNVKADGTIDTTDEFHIPGMTAFICKYWNSMTPEQREVFRAKAVLHVRRNDHGTENHAAMNTVSSYLLAQMWPSETNWVAGFNNSTLVANAWQNSAQMSATARTNITNFVKALYSAGQSEDNSTTYTQVQLFAWHSLYNGCEALIARNVPEVGVGGTVQKIAEVKSIAEAAIVYFTVSLAARQHAHITLAPHQRSQFTHQNIAVQGGTDACGFHWLYWRDISGRVNRRNVHSNVADSVLHASSWTPSPAIISLARGEMAPFVITSSSPQFGIWGQPTTSGSKEGERYPDKTLGYAYRDKLFGMGSCCPTYSGNLNDGAVHAGFNIAYKTANRFGEIDAYHEYYFSNSTTRRFSNWGGTQSPFTQMAQYKNCTIMLLDIPNADPFQATAPSVNRDQYYSNLRKDLFIRYPSTVTSEHQQSGWLFLEEVTADGSVYVAIYTAQPYTIANGTASNISSSFTSTPQDLKLVTSNGAKNVAIFDVSSSDYFPSFLAFRTAVLANPPTVSVSGTVSATYTTTRGATIAATWAAPNYTINGTKLNLCSVTLKPNVTVTTETAQTITELFPAARGGSDRRFSGRPPLDAPFLNMQSGTSMTLTAPRGTHSVVWNGDVPTITVT